MSLGGFAVAIVGTFISFLPLLQILLPLKAMAIMPGAPATLLGAVSAFGAVIAGIANIGVGWWSDRTRTRLGRRRPWILGGLAGILVSYALVWQARTGLDLFIAIGLFQLALNAMFSPLLALVADRVPPQRRGRISALVALGNPIGTMVGAIGIGSFAAKGGVIYLALGTVAFISVAPFAILLGPDPTRRVARVADLSAPREVPRLPFNFALGCLARICVLVASTIAQFYVLFYVQAMLAGQGSYAVGHGVELLCTVFGIVSIIASIAMGQISDRVGRRKPIVVAAALLVGTGMLGLALAPSLAPAIAAYALFAAGMGAHNAIEFALMVDILPSPERSARDLGILNLSNIVPQIIAPLSVAWIDELPGATIHWSFAAGAVAAVIGAGLVSLMRSVP
jgi:MFS family permease